MPNMLSKLNSSGPHTLRVWIHVRYGLSDLGGRRWSMKRRNPRWDGRRLALALIGGRRLGSGSGFSSNRLHYPCDDIWLLPNPRRRIPPTTALAVAFSINLAPIALLAAIHARLLVHTSVCETRFVTSITFLKSPLILATPPPNLNSPLRAAVLQHPVIPKENVQEKFRSHRLLVLGADQPPQAAWTIPPAHRPSQCQHPPLEYQ